MDFPDLYLMMKLNKAEPSNSWSAEFAGFNISSLIIVCVYYKFWTQQVVMEFSIIAHFKANSHNLVEQ